MNPTAGQTRLLRAPAELFPSLHRALGEGRSPTEAATLLRQVGYGMGESVLRALKERTSEAGAEGIGSLEEDEFWDALGALFGDWEWGELRFARLHPGVAALESGDWAEADALVGAEHPGCHLSVGLLADLLGRAGQAEVAVMEVECRAAGDARCRFLLGGEGTLNAVFGGMQRGESPSEVLMGLQ